MGHACDSCCHWRGDSMWKGSPCYIGFEPGTCSEPRQICPFCKESFTDDSRAQAFQDLRNRAESAEAALIAAQKENERRYTHEEVAAWLFEYHGRYREKTLTEFVRERRAVIATADARGK